MRERSEDFGKDIEAPSDHARQNPEPSRLFLRMQYSQMPQTLRLLSYKREIPLHTGKPFFDKYYVLSPNTDQRFFPINTT